MLLRYPGGKQKLKDQIISKLLEIYEDDSSEYREPFFGSGSIGFNLIKPPRYKFKQYWINDADKALAALWNSVIKNPDKLKSKINSFVPSVSSFYSFQEELLNIQKVHDEVDIGFKKLATHQMSYSGLGTKAGGPIGGTSQSSKYDVGCRWSPRTLHKNINNIISWTKGIKIRLNRCTNFDFEKIILDDRHKALIYLDPPYYEKGNDLYEFGFSEEDHVRLSEALRKTKHKWVLSYDDCPAVRMLYQGWTNIDEITLKYTITGSRTKTELLISKK